MTILSKSAMSLRQLKSFLNKNIEKVLNKLDIKFEILGDNIYATCPVHESSDNPRAFSFSRDRGIWKCWTRECQHTYKNDIFGLIRGVLSQRSGTEANFAQVLSWINEEFDLYPTSINTKQLKENEDHENEFEVLIKNISDDITFPDTKECILEPKVIIPSKYFIGRGFLPETLKYFGVGDCVDKSSKLYERSIIPIYSDCGKHKIGFIGRSIKEYKLPKFLIYPKGFDKKFYLYNFHNAVQHIQKTNTVFIVEGQGDLWKLHEAGIYNTVGIFGRTLSREQQKKLQTLPITRIIVLTDNDQAGRESKIQLQRQLGRFYKLNFPYLNQKDIGDMTVKQIKEDILSQL